MSASRKGLKRAGMRSYLLAAAGCGYIIRRQGSRKWSVRKSDQPDLGYVFFGVLFHTLREARAWAWDQIFPGKPKRRIRRQRRRKFKVDPRALLLAARKIAEQRKRDGAE